MLNNKSIISTIIFFCCVSLSGQISVYDISLDSIAAWVNNNPARIYNLNNRCKDPKYTMTPSEYFYIYYGSAFIDSYNPYSERIISSRVNEYLTAEKYDSAISLSKDQLENHPGSIRPYYLLGMAYNKKGDTAMAGVYFSCFFNFLRIPFQSGTGKSTDSAFVVRSIDDEYLIMSELRYNVMQQSLIEDENDIPYDVLNVRHVKDTSETKTFYFNIYLPFKLGMKNMSRNKE